jgi:hypothetical protein
MCTTADTSKQARANVQRLESQRQIHVQGSIAQRQSEIDQASLSGWQSLFSNVNVVLLLSSNFIFAALHERIGGTDQMEELPDIASGQSHRAALHAAMRARECQSSQHGTYGNFSHPVPSAGRGGQHIVGRGRGSPLPSNRTPSVGVITKAGRTGPPHRSATVSFGLDPALNINNDPNEDDSHAFGRGQRGSRGRRRAGGYPQERSPTVSCQPQRQQRPMIDFANKIADPSNFMSSYRQSFEAPIISVSANASKQLNSHPGPPAPMLVANSDGKKVKVAHASFPFERPKGSSRVVPHEKTGQFTKPMANSTASDKTVVDKVVVGHIGSYTVETPTPLPRKILPLNKPKLKVAPPPIKTVQPPATGSSKMQIAWKVPAGEHPRKKETLVSGPTTPVAPKIKTPVFAQEIEPKEVKRPLAYIPNVKVVPKEQDDDDNQAWSGSLLDTANSPIRGEVSDVLVPAPSPAVVGLGSVDFSDKSFKAFDAPVKQSRLEYLEERIEQLEGLVKGAGGMPEHIQRYGFMEWLDQADPNEAASIRDAIRDASFSKYRSHSPPASESSPVPSPIKKPRARVPTTIAGKTDKDKFADRFSVSCLTISKSRFTIPEEVAKNSKTLAPPPKTVSATTEAVSAFAKGFFAPPKDSTTTTTTTKVVPAAAKVFSVPIKATPQSRSVTKKAQTLNDSIYAFKENRIDAPSEPTQPKTDDVAQRVKVIGVQPFNLSRRK